MRLKRLTASNAKQYHNVDLDLSQVRLASIIGCYTFNRSKSNGAGKSTLGDLIMYALFETVPDKSLSTSDLVSWGASKMQVSLEFEYEGNQYVVARAYSPDSRTKNTMDLTINDVPQGKDIIERRQILAERLGISDQIAQATWFFQQSGANKLTVADPKDRKDYLAAVLDADKYEKAYIYAKEKCGEIDRNIEQARKAAAQLQEVTAQIAAADEQIKIFNDKRVSYQNNITINRQRLAEITNKLAVVASQRSQAESEHVLTQRLNQAKAGLADVERMKQDVEGQLAEHRAEVAQAQDALNRLDSEKQAADQQFSSITSKWKGSGYTENFAVEVNKYVWDYKLKIGQAKQRVLEIQKKIDGVDGIELNCPTCGQCVDEVHRAKFTADLQQQIREIEEQAKHDQAQLDAMYQNEMLAVDDDRAMKHLKQVIDAYHSSSATLRSKVSTAVVIEQNINSQLANLNDQIGRFNVTIAELNSKIEQAKHLASFDDASLEADKINLERYINSEQEAADSYTANAAKWQSYRDGLNEQRAKLEQAALSLQALEEELKVRQTVAQLFHRDGLPLSKISSACALIEAYANSMMSTVLPNYHLKIEVESGKRGKLDFMVNTPGGLQPYAVLSGGEQAIAGLCLRMALSRILAEGSGHRFETLFLDEVFAELDQVYRPIMMNLVKELSKSFKAIFVISHELEIQTAFPQVVLVECDGKQSHIKVLENNEVE